MAVIARRLQAVFGPRYFRQVIELNLGDILFTDAECRWSTSCRI